jgi:hypothetical protein
MELLVFYDRRIPESLRASWQNSEIVSMFDVGLLLIHNLSMRFPGELRIRMNNSLMNQENIQPACAVEGLRRRERLTSNVQHPTNCGAFP